MSTTTTILNFVLYLGGSKTSTFFPRLVPSCAQRLVKIAVELLSCCVITDKQTNDVTNRHTELTNMLTEIFI